MCRVNGDAVTGDILTEETLQRMHLDSVESSLINAIAGGPMRRAMAEQSSRRLLTRTAPNVTGCTLGIL